MILPNSTRGLDRQGLLDPRVHKAPLGLMGLSGMTAQRDQRGVKAQREQQALKAPRVLRVQQAQRVLKDQQGLPGLKALREVKVRQARRVRPVRMSSGLQAPEHPQAVLGMLGICTSTLPTGMSTVPSLEGVGVE